MNTLSNKKMIEHLARFRDAGDKLSEDVFGIALKIFEIIAEIEAKNEIAEGEAAVLSKLKGMSEMLLRATLDANEYNDSMWKDYTKVIKALGESKGAKPND